MEGNKLKLTGIWSFRLGILVLILAWILDNTLLSILSGILLLYGVAIWYIFSNGGEYNDRGNG